MLLLFALSAAQQTCHFISDIMDFFSAGNGYDQAGSLSRLNL